MRHKKNIRCRYPAICEYCTEQLNCTYKDKCGYKVKTIPELASWALLFITSKLYEKLRKK